MKYKEKMVKKQIKGEVKQKAKNAPFTTVLLCSCARYVRMT